jgi:hypothetical protein
VWHDADRDGHQDAGEAGLAGVRLDLLEAGVSLDFEITDAAGDYVFAGVAPGPVYRVDADDASLPGGYTLTTHGDPLIMVPAPGQDIRTADFGYASPVTPSPTPPSQTNVDLFFAGWDWVQVADGAPLVADKPTVVRVYVGVRGAGGPVTNVSGRLLRVGEDDWNSALRSTNRITVDPAEDPYLDNREDIDGALYFRLPDDWRQGAYWANVWINYGGAVEECAGCADNNLGSELISFHETDPLDLFVLRVTVGVSIATWADVANTTPHLRHYLPVPYLTVLRHPSDGFAADYAYDGPREAGACAEGFSDLLDDLRDIAADTDESGLSHPKYYGLLPSDLVASHGGCGSTGGDVAAGKALGQRTMTHEVTHNTGQRHNPSDPDDPNCSDPGRVDDNYPNPSGHLVGYGIDTRTEPPTISPEATTYDLMTYCKPKVMSAYTFEGVMNYFDPGQMAASGAMRVEPSAAVRGAALAAGGGYLRVAGQLHGEVVTALRPFYQVSAAPGSDQPGSGTLAIQLRDGSGQALFTRYFEPQAYGDVHDDLDTPQFFNPGGPAAPHDHAGPAFFQEVLPFAAGTARIVILHHGVEVASRAVSASAPVVDLLAPDGGQGWGASGTQTIAWASSDADGDPLWHTLQYSPDGGAHWLALAVNVTGSQYVLDAAALAGSQQALVRVTATDGVNTAQDVSAAVFSVAPKPPQVHILSPMSGSVVPPGALVELEGLVLDLEDGRVAESALTWSSDRQGVLGTGINQTTASLAPGWHTLTLTAQDASGMTATSSTRLFVGDQLWLPLTLR